MFRGRQSSGATLIELAVVVVIVGILATMLLPLFSHYAGRADEAKCFANLRSLHVAASGYLLQNESWPQIAVQLRQDNPKDFAKQWVAALVPFGAPYAVWICPTALRALGQTLEKVTQGEDIHVDYVPMAFDDRSSSPHRWERFPWFIEKGDLHGRGNLIIFADGSTVSFQELVGKGNNGNP